MTPVRLREVAPGDLPVFFEHQRDPEAVRQAGFTAKDPEDRAAFDAHWARILADPAIVVRTIETDGEVAGHVSVFPSEGDLEVTYWVDRAYWGRGLATAALTALVAELPAGPLHARVAADNLGSRRVLEKCGFRKIGDDRGFANARGEEIAEEIYLREPAP